MIWRAVTFFALLISVAAFAIAILAYHKAGGDIEQLRQVVRSTRRGTVNALDRLEEVVREYRQRPANDSPKEK